MTGSPLRHVGWKYHKADSRTTGLDAADEPEPPDFNSAGPDRAGWRVYGLDEENAQIVMGLDFTGVAPLPSPSWIVTAAVALLSGLVLLGPTLDSL